MSWWPRPSVCGPVRAKIDTVARLGGDEFAVVQTGIGHPDDAAELAGRIVRALAEPFDIDEHKVLISASLGIAMGGTDGTDIDTLLKNADLALYRAKEDGRGAYRCFEPEMDARVQRWRAIGAGFAPRPRQR